VGRRGQPWTSESHSNTTLCTSVVTIAIQNIQGGVRMTLASTPLGEASGSGQGSPIVIADQGDNTGG
jgi:hypothetical protein